MLRNPKEAITRNLGKTDPKMFFSGQALKKMRLYFEDLDIFDKWQGRKIIVYYEDFMSHPLTTLEKVTTFLDAYNVDVLNDFFQHYDEHKAKAIKFYDNFGGSNTLGNDLLYYSRQLPFQTRKNMDEWARRNYPTLWEKYLKERYSEDVLVSRGLY